MIGYHLSEPMKSGDLMPVMMPVWPGNRCSSAASGAAGRPQSIEAECLATAGSAGSMLLAGRARSAGKGGRGGARNPGGDVTHTGYPGNYFRFWAFISRVGGWPLPMRERPGVPACFSPA